MDDDSSLKTERTNHYYRNGHEQWFYTKTATDIETQRSSCMLLVPSIGKLSLLQ
jgi:hypothetical protein